MSARTPQTCIAHPIYTYIFIYNDIIQNNSYKTDDQTRRWRWRWWWWWWWRQFSAEAHRESGSLLVVEARQRRVVTKGTCFTFSRVHTHTRAHGHAHGRAHKCAFTRTHWHMRTHQHTGARRAGSPARLLRCCHLYHGPLCLLHPQHVVISLLLSSSITNIIISIVITVHTLSLRAEAFCPVRIVLCPRFICLGRKKMNSNVKCVHV